MRAAFIGRTTPRRDRVGNSGLASQSRAERRRAPRPKKLPALCALLRMSREQAARLAA